jgi:hypothetical protein
MSKHQKKSKYTNNEKCFMSPVISSIFVCRDTLIGLVWFFFLQFQWSSTFIFNAFYEQIKSFNSVFALDIFVFELKLQII